MIDDFFAVVVIVAGVYALYAARELKQAHHIVTSVIRVPEGKTCKDMDGLVRYMFPRLMLLACSTCLLGVYEFMLSLQESASTTFSVIEVVLCVVFFGIMIYYLICVKKLEEMFY